MRVCGVIRVMVGATVVVAMAVCWTSPAGAATTYVRKGTWVDSLVASLQADKCGAASKGLFDRLLADFQDDAKTVRALIDAFESSAKASGLTMAREHRTYGDLTKWLASVRAKWKAT